MLREGKQGHEKLQCRTEFGIFSPTSVFSKLLLSVNDMVLVHFVCVSCLDSLDKPHVRGTMILWFRELEASGGLNNSMWVFSRRPLP